jgi:hypothetical protein
MRPERANREEAVMEMNDHAGERQRVPTVTLWIEVEVEHTLPVKQGRFVLTAFEELRARAATNTSGELLVFDPDLVARIRHVFNIKDSDLPRPVRDGVVIEYLDRLGYVSAQARDVLDARPVGAVQEAKVLPSARFASALMRQTALGVPHRLWYRSVALAEQDREDERYAEEMRR